MIKKIFNKLFNKTPNNTISFQSGFDLTSLPVITLYQGDKKFNFLLDTGSNNSIIDGNILDQIEHTVLNDKTALYGLEGISNVRSMCKIKLYYKNDGYEYTYVIADMKKPFDNIKAQTGVTLHGLLGSKFFNAYKYVLDFDELIAYSKK